MKKTGMNILRAVISFGLLAYLISIADIAQIYETIKQANMAYLGLALLIFTTAIFVLSLRWQILLNQVDIRPGYFRLVVFYFIGYFLNNFLPTSIGGDVSRAYNIAKTSGRHGTGVASVLLERMLGLLATLTLASLSVFWVAELFQTDLIIIVTIGMLAFVVFVLLNLFNPTLFGFSSRLLKKIHWWGIGDKIVEVFATIHDYRQSKAAVLQAYLLSLCAQFLVVVMNYVLAQALALKNITFGYLLLVIPVTFVISMAPSINGLGVRDFGYESLLSKIGIDTSQALSLSFLNTLTPMIISIIGGIMLIFYRNKATVAVAPIEDKEKI